MQRKKEIKLKHGDIILIKGRWWNPLSKLIELLTFGPYSHSAVYLARGKIIEASWTGVIISSINRYKNRYDVFRLKDEYLTIESMMWFIANKIGAKYDYLGLIGILLSIIGKRKHNDYDDKNRYWCSELIADGLLFAEYDVNFDKDTCRVSPNDLFRLFKKLRKF